MSDDEESLPKNTSAARESGGKAGAHRALPLTGHATPLHPAAEEGRGGALLLPLAMLMLTTPL